MIQVQVHIYFDEAPDGDKHVGAYRSECYVAQFHTLPQAGDDILLTVGDGCAHGLKVVRVEHWSNASAKFNNPTFSDDQRVETFQESKPLETVIVCAATGICRAQLNQDLRRAWDEHNSASRAEDIHHHTGGKFARNRIESGSDKLLEGYKP